MRAPNRTRAQRRAEAAIKRWREQIHDYDLLPCPDRDVNHPPDTPCVCEWCGAVGARGVCPRSLSCPTCDQPPGAPCKRPSEHTAPELHAARVAAAEAMDHAAGVGPARQA